MKRRVDGYMVYGCNECGQGFKMYLEVGLEVVGDGANHKPVPFAIQCPFCNGFHYFTIDELFGKSISSIYFNYDEPIYCKEHAKMLGFIYTGGDK